MICSPTHWIIAITCYVASFVGDLFDGMAARKYNQCSAFGGLIDMVTDRCSTAGLLCVLSREYSEEPTLVLVRHVQVADFSADMTATFHSYAIFANI